MNAFLRFNQGVLGMPVPWRLWLLVLVAFNGIAPLFFLPRLEALVTLGAFAIGVGLMTLLTSWTGFSRLLGLGHAPWVPLLLFLCMRLESAPAHEPFGLWIRGVIALDAISLVIDTRDVIRWMAGERGETVENTSTRSAG